MISHNRKTIARTLGTDHDPVRGELRWGRAACRDYDPELWFPVGNPATDSVVWDKPRAVCNTVCPMRDECLRNAIDADDDPWGMCGGKTPDELKAIRHSHTCKDCPRPVDEGHDRCTDCQRAKWREYKRASTPIRECPGCGVVRRIRSRGLCGVCLRAMGVAS